MPQIIFNTNQIQLIADLGKLKSNPDLYSSNKSLVVIYGLALGLVWGTYGGLSVIGQGGHPLEVRRKNGGFQPHDRVNFFGACHFFRSPHP